MTTTQRTAISNPATGLLVFDNTTAGFWFYNGTAWQDLSATAIPDRIADADNDTKIQVEETVDEDIIRFDAGGTEMMVIQNSKVALGISTQATGMYSTAMGNQTTASGELSTAMGKATTASGESSTAMGSITTASGVGSTAMGNQTTASGSGSTAMGVNTTASAANSTAMGAGTIANSTAETALGLSLIHI